MARYLPPEFGKWNIVFKRYRDWIKATVFENIFAAIYEDADIEYAMIDVSSTVAQVVKVHRHGQGAKGGPIVRLLENPEVE